MVPARPGAPCHAPGHGLLNDPGPAQRKVADVTAPVSTAPLVRLVPVIVGGAVATVAPQQGIDEGLTDKLAVAIG